MTRVFAEVGFEKAELRAVPNPYSQDPYHFPPGFLVDTEHGLIGVHRRKRVYAVEWGLLDEEKRAATNGDVLFADLDVTHGVAIVHAWTHETLVAYLRRLREALEGADSSRDETAP